MSDKIRRVASDRGTRPRCTGSVRRFGSGRLNRPVSPAAVCGLGLAHVKKDRVKAAYQRSDFFERRRALMQAWAHYVSAVDHSVHVHQYA